MHCHAFQPAHQLIDNRAVTQFKPPATPRFADNYSGRLGFDYLGTKPFGHRCSGDCGERRAHFSGKLQRLGNARACFLAQRCGSRRFYCHCGPCRAHCVGEALGRADQRLAARLVADSNYNPFGRRPVTRFPHQANVVEHLGIYRLRGASQRQFAQCRQICLGKKVTERTRRFVRHIDFAVL